MRLFISLVLSCTLMSCEGFFINERSLFIGSLSTESIEAEVWKEIFMTYNVDDSKSRDLEYIKEKFKEKRRKSIILYFPSGPEEYVGISANNHDLITFVYNDSLSTQLLDNLSPELSEAEKVRIILRVNTILMSYMNDNGKLNAVKRIHRQIGDALEYSSKDKLSLSWRRVAFDDYARVKGMRESTCHGKMVFILCIANAQLDDTRYKRTLHGA